MIAPYKEKTLTRLKKTKGQIEGIIKMVEDDKYCVDIGTQVLALEGSLKAIHRLILESHLNTCGAHKLNSKDPKEKKEFIDEILKVVDYTNR